MRRSSYRTYVPPEVLEIVISVSWPLFSANILYSVACDDEPPAVTIPEYKIRKISDKIFGIENKFSIILLIRPKPNKIRVLDMLNTTQRHKNLGGKGTEGAAVLEIASIIPENDDAID